MTHNGLLKVHVISYFFLKFINIFQTQRFSAIKFYLGYEKNMSFIVILQSQQVGKKVEKIGLGSSNKSDDLLFYFFFYLF